MPDHPLTSVGGGGVIVEAEGPAGELVPDTWVEVDSLGTARQELAGASDADGLVYAIGGESDANFHESVAEQYDPSTDTWTTVASLGTARRRLAGASDADGFIYAIGGWADANDYESVVEKLLYDGAPVDAYSATGDTLFAADDPDAELLNRTTDRSVTGDSLIARDGETIAWFVESQARLYRTEEQ